MRYLSLGGNQLTGSIPTELGALTNLESLSLGSNPLTGTIPRELGALTNLRSLSLSRSGLTGTIPAELGALTNLRQLWLYSNHLTGNIPDEFGQLARDHRGVPPALRSVNGTAPRLSEVTIAVNTSPIPEGTSASFTVTRDGGTLTDPLTLNVEVTESGTMIAGTPPASVTFATNETSATLTVPTDTTDRRV